METEKTAQKKTLDINLAIIFGITLMAVLGVSSITPVFPQMMRELNLTDKQVALLITVFTLPGAVLTPFLGIAADRFGRKRILLPSLLLFGVAGGACGFARDYTALLLLRFLQGIGGAALGSLNTTIIGDLYEGLQRVRTMGLNASVLSIGTAFYPLIGGSLATMAWYYPFLLPWLAVPLCLIVLKYLKNPEPKNNQALGSYLRSAWQAVKTREVLGVFISGILIFIILYGSYLTYFSIFLGEIFAASPFMIGLIMFSTSISTAAFSSQLHKINSRFNKKNLLMLGFAGYAASFFLIPFIPQIWLFFIPTILLGAVQGLNIPTLQTILAEQAPLEYRAVFMSLNGSILRLGQTLGPVVVGAVFAFGGYNGAFWAGTAAALIGILVIKFMLPGSE